VFTVSRQAPRVLRWDGFLDWPVGAKSNLPAAALGIFLAGIGWLVIDDGRASVEQTAATEQLSAGATEREQVIAQVVVGSEQNSAATQQVSAAAR